jgi:hypothetical protein
VATRAGVLADVPTLVINYFLYPQASTYAMNFDALLKKLEEELQAGLGAAVEGFVATARTQLENALTDVANERVMGLAEVAKEKADLHREIAAMQKQQEA